MSNGGGGGTVGRGDVVHLGRTLVENGEIDLVLGHGDSVCMLFALILAKSFFAFLWCFSAWQEFRCDVRNILLSGWVYF